MTYSKLPTSLCAALSVALLPIVAGCHRAEAPAPHPAVSAANGYGAQGMSNSQLSALAKKSGGDWNKLNQVERKRILEDAGGGNPAVAQAALRNAASQ